MFHKDAFRQNLLGAVEIALFMPVGIKRLRKATAPDTARTAMRRSFLIPFMLLPLTIVTALAAHPDGPLSAPAQEILVAIYSLRLVLYLAGFMGFVYIMARVLGRLEDFHHFVIASNWLGVPVAALMLLPVILFLGGVYTGTQVYPFIVFCTLYSCACTAFMATHLLRIPCELAVFIAVTGMTIQHNALGLLKWAAVSTLYLLA